MIELVSVSDICAKHRNFQKCSPFCVT